MNSNNKTPWLFTNLKGLEIDFYQIQHKFREASECAERGTGSSGGNKTG